MPKIRDLGINVIPETMRPPEIGPGGGGGGCQNSVQCPTTTFPTTPWGMHPGCPTGTFTITGGGGCGSTQNCPTTTFPTTPLVMGGTGCPGGTFTHTGAWWANAAQVHEQPYQPATGCPGGTLTHTGWANAAYKDVDYTGCPGGTLTRPSEFTCWESGGITREWIERLKQELQKYIAKLDEWEKSIGPKTLEEIEAREKQLQAELEDMARRRKEFKATE